MSRSCHSATFSSAGTTAARTTRARPGQVLRQHRVALVRHRRRALLARREIFLGLAAPRCAADGGFRAPSRSTELAMTAKRREIDMAWRSRGMIWVETGSGVEAQLCRDIVPRRAGSTLAKVPTAPEIAQVAISSAARTSRVARARELGVEAGELQAEGRRLGMDAVAAADADRVLVLEGAALQRGQQRVEIGRAGCRSPASAARRGRCRARRSRSCPDGRSAPRARHARRGW